MRNFLISIICSLLFLVLLIIAMLFYPGGSYIDFNSNFYAFHHNFLSDLGRKVAMNGEPSTITPIIFMFAMLVMGFGQFIYFLGVRTLISNSQTEKRVNNLSSLFSFLAGLFYMGVGIAPADTHSQVHNAFVFLAFGSITLAMIVQMFVLFSKDNNLKSIGFLYILILVMVVIHIGTMILFWEQFEPFKLISKVVTQKIVLLTVVGVIIRASYIGKRYQSQFQN